MHISEALANFHPVFASADLEVASQADVMLLASRAFLHTNVREEERVTSVRTSAWEASLEAAADSVVQPRCKIYCNMFSWRFLFSTSV